MFKLNRLEKTIFLLVAMLGPALVLAWWLQSWTVLCVFGFILGFGGAYIWRPQGRDPRNGKFISKILVVSASLLVLFWSGCGLDDVFTIPQEPGKISNQREVMRWTFAAPSPPVIFTIPSTIQPSAKSQSPQIIVVQPSGSPMPATVETIRESTNVTQPENAAGEASLVTGNSAGANSGGGGTKASIPPSYAPPKPPAAATPTQKALGGLVWVGAALVVLGMLAMGLRFLPWTAALGAVIPIGVSVLVALSGGLLIAYATVLAEAPWWVIGLCVAGVVAIGYLTATRHNWQLMFGGTRAAPVPPVPPPNPTPTITT